MRTMLDSLRNNSPLLVWAPIILGLVILYAPTYHTLYSKVWVDDEYRHGAIVAAVFGWMIWRLRHDLLRTEFTPSSLAGGFFILCGMSLLLIGRRSAIPLFEASSQIPMLFGLLLFIRGWVAAKLVRFPMVFLLFMVPLPSILVYMMTAALKEWNAEAAVQILYAAGFPVAREGVVITIGQYQLFLADACAGMHSLFTLLAMGLLFIYLSGGRSFGRKALLAACIIPVALLSNLARVLVLLLVTYKFGEAPAEFFHEFVGYACFAVGLAFLLFLDAKLLEGRR